MAVRIRFSRTGRRNRAYFRIGAYDQHSPQGGVCLENLGTYDPQKPENEVQIKAERYAYWLSVGAKPTPQVAAVLKHIGFKPGVPAGPSATTAPAAPAKTA